MRPNDVAQALDLDRVAKDHVWKVEPSCATSGEGKIGDFEQENNSLISAVLTSSFRYLRRPLLAQPKRQGREEVKSEDHHHLSSSRTSPSSPPSVPPRRKKPSKWRKNKRIWLASNQEPIKRTQPSPPLPPLRPPQLCSSPPSHPPYTIESGPPRNWIPPESRAGAVAYGRACSEKDGTKEEATTQAKNEKLRTRQTTGNLLDSNICLVAAGEVPPFLLFFSPLLHI